MFIESVNDSAEFTPSETGSTDRASLAGLITEVGQKFIRPHHVLQKTLLHSISSLYRETFKWIRICLPRDTVITRVVCSAKFKLPYALSFHHFPEDFGVFQIGRACLQTVLVSGIIFRLLVALFFLPFTIFGVVLGSALTATGRLLNTKKAHTFFEAASDSFHKNL
ncbi:MAG: hypothetical protein AAGE99_03090 [Chlamydiota bacterium]